MLEARGFRTCPEAAAIFRLGRAKDVSLTTIDALIAAIALEHRASVFTLDKDFSQIACLTGLPIQAVLESMAARKCPLTTPSLLSSDTHLLPSD